MAAQDEPLLPGGGAEPARQRLRKPYLYAERPRRGHDPSGDVSWRAPGYDFDGYAVYRRKVGGEPELIATLGGTASVYTDTSVEYGHTYVYTVAARVGGDIFDEDYRAEVGGDSREVAVTPPELPSAPPEDAPPAQADTSEEPKQDTEAESKPEAGIYVAAVFGAAALVAAVGSVKGGKNQKGKRSK